MAKKPEATIEGAIAAIDAVRGVLAKKGNLARVEALLGNAEASLRKAVEVL